MVFIVSFEEINEMGLNSEVVLKRGFPVVVFTESDSIIRQQLFIYIYMTFIC